MLLTSLCLAVASVGAPQSSASDVRVFDRDNVVICLDASGSMKERMPGTKLSKMQAAHQAIATVLAGVPSDTQVGLLVFSGAGKEGGDWVFPLGERDDETLIRRLNRITPNGGTPLGAYMIQGTEALMAQRVEQNGYGTYRLLVVTDGEASDKDVLEAAMPDIRTRGLMLDVIGVNMSGQHSLANDVNSYRRADDSTALQEAIRQVFAEVGSKGSDDMEDDFQLLAALPNEAVKGVIDSIAIHNDSPIELAVSSRSSGKGRPNQAPGQGSGSGGGSGPAGSPGGGGFNTFDPDDDGPSPMIFIAVALMLFFVVRAKSRSRNR